MKMETTNKRLNIDYKDLELFKMRKELLEFVVKMKSKGYLSTVDYNNLPLTFESEYRD